MNYFVIWYLLSLTYSICKELPFENYPSDISSIIRNIIDKEECLKEIENIYKKDFKSIINNPYSITTSQEKMLNRTLIQINKKINKYNIYITKNFTGIRWINSKNVEIKRMLNNYFTHIIEYFEKNFLSCKNTLPEFVLESYQFFFSKLSDVKKIFQKFYLFKGVKKFNNCLAIYNTKLSENKFGENIINGNMTVKEIMNKLREFVNGITMLTKSVRLDDIGKAMKMIILSLTGIPWK